MKNMWLVSALLLFSSQGFCAARVDSQEEEYFRDNDVGQRVKLGLATGSDFSVRDPKGDTVLQQLAGTVAPLGVVKKVIHAMRYSEARSLANGGGSNPLRLWGLNAERICSKIAEEKWANIIAIYAFRFPGDIHVQDRDGRIPADAFKGTGDERHLWRYNSIVDAVEHAHQHVVPKLRAEDRQRLNRELNAHFPKVIARVVKDFYGNPHLSLYEFVVRSPIHYPVLNDLSRGWSHPHLPGEPYPVCNDLSCGWSHE